MPIKRIAKLVGVSPASVFDWTRDIELTPEQNQRNLYVRGPLDPVLVRRRNERVRNTARQRRLADQAVGRARAREGDALHQAGCMLYWAEGAKSPTTLTFTNSDVAMVCFFVRFLRESLGVADLDITVRLNVYTNNGISLREIEDHWLWALGLPRSSLRKHQINHQPTSSSGKRKRKRKLPYGVCTVRPLRSSGLVQHIFGGIQEYAGFDEPRWAESPPRTKPRPG